VAGQVRVWDWTLRCGGNARTRGWRALKLGAEDGGLCWDVFFSLLLEAASPERTVDFIRLQVERRVALAVLIHFHTNRWSKTILSVDL
jgi:hypothetical protein